jgi:hypothetical protein
MHEYFVMPPALSAAYVAYWAICAVYAAYQIGACAFSAAHRARVHRGSWLHVGEGWALVAVVWAAWLWARIGLSVAEHHWSGVPPMPTEVRIAAVALYLLHPLALLSPAIMAAVTVTRAWRPPRTLATGAERPG